MPLTRAQIERLVRGIDPSHVEQEAEALVHEPA